MKEMLEDLKGLDELITYIENDLIGEHVSINLFN